MGWVGVVGEGILDCVPTLGAVAGDVDGYALDLFAVGEKATLV